MDCSFKGRVHAIHRFDQRPIDKVGEVRNTAAQWNMQTEKTSGSEGN